MGNVPKFVVAICVLNGVVLTNASLDIAFFLHIYTIMCGVYLFYIVDDIYE